MENNNQNSQTMHGKGCTCWACGGMGYYILLRILISIILALAIFYLAFKLGEMKGFIDSEFYQPRMMMTYPNRMMYGNGGTRMNSGMATGTMPTGQSGAGQGGSY